MCNMCYGLLLLHIVNWLRTTTTTTIIIIIIQLCHVFVCCTDYFDNKCVQQTTQKISQVKIMEKEANSNENACLSSKVKACLTQGPAYKAV